MASHEAPEDVNVRVWPGGPHPLGATWDGEGVNFALFSEQRDGRATAPLRRRNAPAPDRDDHMGSRPTTSGTRTCPTCVPARCTATGSRALTTRSEDIDSMPSKLLIDPYAKAVSGPIRWSDELYGYTVGDEAGPVLRHARLGGADAEVPRRGPRLHLAGRLATQHARGTRPSSTRPTCAA